MRPLRLRPRAQSDSGETGVRTGARCSPEEELGLGAAETLLQLSVGEGHGAESGHKRSPSQVTQGSLLQHDVQEN